MTPENTVIRYRLEQGIRDYFRALDYLEVRTPLLVQSPGMEPHIRPIQIGKSFLPTSPEFAMKKLLARGLPRIFQICSSFRDEPISPEHRPEFTMLEFYESNLSLEGLQGRVEGLFITLAKTLGKGTQLPFRGETIDISGPWPRYRIVDLFQKHVGVDLRTHDTRESLIPACEQFKILVSENDSWDDLYFKLWLNEIEPKLPTNRACFVTHYPRSQSSLCNPIADETGYLWANRFEVYVGAFELGNAFDELRDPRLQRQNFLHDQKVRRETYGDSMPTSPIDEEFMTAIAKMPPTSGIALGLDRIAMLMMNADTISDVIPIEPYWPNQT